MVWLRLVQALLRERRMTLAMGVLSGYLLGLFFPNSLSNAVTAHGFYPVRA
jgi:hypothetical protein